jgi:hypothetical protein
VHRGQGCSVGDRLFNRNLEIGGESSMSITARARLSSNGKKSASVLEFAPTRGSGRRTDPKARERRNGLTLLERLEAENQELRNQAIQLALQIQALRNDLRPDGRSASAPE